MNTINLKGRMKSKNPYCNYYRVTSTTWNVSLNPN